MEAINELVYKRTLEIIYIINMYNEKNARLDVHFQAVKIITEQLKCLGYEENSFFKGLLDEFLNNFGLQTVLKMNRYLFNLDK